MKIDSAHGGYDNVYKYENIVSTALDESLDRKTLYGD